MSATPELLDELRALRRRTHADPRRYAPPLLVFGVLIIASVLLYRPADVPFWQGSQLDLLGGNGSVATTQPGAITAYWFAVLFFGTGFTAAWYHVRAARQGIELRTNAQLMAAGAALLGILVGMPVLWAVLGPYYWPEDEPYVHIPMLVLGAAGAVVVLGRAAGPGRGAGARVAGLLAGFVLATTAAGAVTMYLRGYFALLVIAAVVFALAWVERSRLVAVVAIAFTAVSLLPATRTTAVYEALGWNWWDNPRLGVLQDLLLPSAVLLVGGLAGLAVRLRTR